MFNRMQVWARRKARYAVVGAGVGAIALVAAAPSSAAGKIKVTLGLPVVDATFAPVYIAKDQGLFSKQGLNVTVATFQGGADLTKAVVAGSVQVGVNGLGGIMPAIVQGQPLKVVYGGFNELSYRWYSEKGITTLQQAASKTWGVTKVGSDTDFLTRYLLAKNGIDPSKVTIIGGAVSGPTRIAAMQQNQMQITVGSNPANLQLAAAGYHLLASESDFTKSYPDHMVFAQTSFINKNVGVISKLLTAIGQGMQIEKSNEKLAEQEIIKNVGMTQSLAEHTYRGFVKGQFPDGRLPTAQGMNAFWQAGILNKEFPSVLPESKWLDKRWINSYPNFPKS